MSFDLRTINNEGDNKNNNSIVTYHRRDAHSDSNVYYTSSAVINIQQVQTDLHAQHQHEKHALADLNQRLRLFVDRAQQLEAQNSKYIAQLANFRRQPSGISNIDAQSTERYVHLQSDLTTISYAKVDYEFDFEVFQMQIGIYQQLIDVEQQWKDDGRLKLEQELKQLGSVLITLRTSYAELGREVESLSATREDIFKQYLRLIHDWCSMKKQRKRWDLSLQTLKSHIVFYKNLRSYSVREFESVRSVDVDQFLTLELDKAVKKIRRDFELLYATIHREMTTYYETKINEVQTDVEQALHYQQIEIEELVISQQTLQVEYEEVQKTFSYEKEIRIQLEAKYAKFESDFRSIQLQNEERLEAQSKDLQRVQESIMAVAYDIDEMRRSKINLEAEIIVYRHLLDSSEIHEQVMVAPIYQSVGSEMTGKFIVKNQNHGAIGISECGVKKERERMLLISFLVEECAPNGAYISLVNHSTSKDIDISRWVLKRRIDSEPELRYTIPKGVQLQQGRELRIYSKLGAGAAESASYNRVGSSLSNQVLVNNDLASWGV
ncbi:unnamed protein product, partial [Didymodactylos carnosus]